MEVKVVRERIELQVRDERGTLILACLAQRPGRPHPVETCRVDLDGEDVEFFAGMLLDPGVADPAGKVELKEPYPCVIRVKWEGAHRILSFLPWNEGGPMAVIRLSPLEAWKVGKLAERTSLINHLVARLNREG